MFNAFILYNRIKFDEQIIKYKDNLHMKLSKIIIYSDLIGKSYFKKRSKFSI